MINETLVEGGKRDINLFNPLNRCCYYYYYYLDRINQNESVGSLLFFDFFQIEGLQIFHKTKTET